MRFSDMIEGLQILAKYEPSGLATHLNGADHDVIWASTAEVGSNEDGELVDAVDARITPEDAKRLGDLGWFVSSEFAEAWTHFC